MLSTIGIITLFDLPFVLTGGGPGYMSETIALHVYFYAFVQLKTSYALALAVILGAFRHPHHLDPAADICVGGRRSIL